MKKIRFIALLAAVVSLSSCGVLASIEEESIKEAHAYVTKALSDKELAIEVNTIMPSAGPSIQTVDGYYLKIKDGKVYSYLPFIGSSFSAPFGTDDLGIKFDGCPITVNTRESRPSKGKYVWRFEAVNNNEKVDVTVTFWDSGSADIMCHPVNSSIMNYAGNLIAYPEQ